MYTCAKFQQDRISSSPGQGPFLHPSRLRKCKNSENSLEAINSDFNRIASLLILSNNQLCSLSLSTTSTSFAVLLSHFIAIDVFRTKQ